MSKLICLALALTACNAESSTTTRIDYHREEQPSTASKALPTPASKNTLVVTENGKSVAIESASAFPQLDGSVNLLFSSKRTTCGEAVPDGLDFVITISPRLAPTGKLGWITGGWTYRGAEGRSNNPTPAPKLERGDKFIVELDHVLKTEAATLTARGRFEATTCRTAERAPAGTPTGVVATVAGVDFPITGISAHREGTALSYVVLSTAPRGCDPSVAGAIQILIRWEEGEQTAALTGLYAGALSAPAKGLTVAPLPLPAAGIVKLQLGGSTKLGEYTVALKGSAEVLVCKE